MTGVTARRRHPLAAVALPVLALTAVAAVTAIAAGLLLSWALRGRS